VKRRISRRALFARDGWRCVYCGDSAGRLTLDHVVPRSRGGDSVWENVVTACAPCNLRKGDRLLEETHMHLPRPPRAPSPVLFISLALHRVPDAWLRYLPARETAANAA
jgi:5-methylcytosine-specific restriction endonuclease McrA